MTTGQVFFAKLYPKKEKRRDTHRLPYVLVLWSVQGGIEKREEHGGLKHITNPGCESADQARRNLSFLWQKRKEKKVDMEEKNVVRTRFPDRSA